VTPLLHRVRLLAVSAVLLVAIWLGLKDGLNGVRGADSVPQRIAAMLQLAYGVAAAASLVAIVTRRAWLPWAIAAWVLTITLTGAMAPIVWGGAPWSSGVLGGGATALVTGLVAWAAIAHARSMVRAPEAG
jgi:hypothetical protein